MNGSLFLFFEFSILIIGYFDSFYNIVFLNRLASFRLYILTYVTGQWAKQNPHVKRVNLFFICFCLIVFNPLYCLCKSGSFSFFDVQCLPMVIPALLKHFPMQQL